MAFEQMTLRILTDSS